MARLSKDPDRARVQPGMLWFGELDNWGERVSEVVWVFKIKFNECHIFFSVFVLIVN